FTEAITQFYEGTSAGNIPYHWCDVLHLDKEKNFWLGTEKGIALYDRSKNIFQNYPVSLSGEDTRINKFIGNIFEDSRGRFWLTTSYGAKLFDRKTKTCQSFYYPKKDKNNFSFASIFEDDRKTIWAGTWGDGLFKFDESEHQFEKLMIPE